MLNIVLSIELGNFVILSVVLNIELRILRAFRFILDVEVVILSIKVYCNRLFIINTSVGIIFYT